MTAFADGEKGECELCGRDSASTLKPVRHTYWGKTINACEMCRVDYEFLVEQ